MLQSLARLVRSPLLTHLSRPCEFDLWFQAAYVLLLALAPHGSSGKLERHSRIIAYTLYHEYQRLQPYAPSKSASTSDEAVEIPECSNGLTTQSTRLLLTSKLQPLVCDKRAFSQVRNTEGPPL